MAPRCPASAARSQSPRVAGRSGSSIDRRCTMPRLYIASVLPASAARSYQGRAASGFGGFEWAWRSPSLFMAAAYPASAARSYQWSAASRTGGASRASTWRRRARRWRPAHTNRAPRRGPGVGLIRVLIPAGVHGVAVAATRPSQPTQHFNSPQPSLTNWRRTAGRIPACGSACCRGAPSLGCSRNRAGPAVAAEARPARTGSPSG